MVYIGMETEVDVVTTTADAVDEDEMVLVPFHGPVSV